MNSSIRIQIELPNSLAWAFAQYLKRIGLDDYRQQAADDDEAWDMQCAGEIVRQALAEQGYAPR